MCGIIAIVSRKPNRPAPTPDELIAGLERALSLLGDPAAVAVAAAEVDAALHGLPGVLALADRHDLVASITARLDQLDAYAAEVDGGLAEAALEEGGLDADALEQANAASIALRDALW